VLCTLWRIHGGAGLLEPVDEARIEHLRALHASAAQEWSKEEERWVPLRSRTHPIEVLRRCGTLDEALYVAAHRMEVGDPLATSSAAATFYFPRAVQPDFASRLRAVLFPI
jgi:hypothetical protein